MKNTIVQYLVETEIVDLERPCVYSVEAENELEAYDCAKQLWMRENNSIPFPTFSECKIQPHDEVLLDDNDTDDSEKDESSQVGIYPYYSEDSSIDVNEEHFSIFEYLRQLKKGKIFVQPEFQRNKVWNAIQKSRFIESVILNFPLPPIYLNQNVNNDYIVIDGLQRTTALADFFEDKYILSGLEALPHYNGMRFSDLSDTLQSKLENKKLTIFSLKPSTPMYVIYDLFKRINTGGTQLNRQEIRNCIYIGKATRLLKDLSISTAFLKATDYGISPSRMKDREVVLRYVAFRWGNYETAYEGDMSAFLEDFMRKINVMPNNEIDLIKKDFIRVMGWASIIFGRNAFRIPSPKTRGVVNTAVLESVGYYLSMCTDQVINNHQDDIRQAYNHLISSEEYRNIVSHSTASKSSVHARFTLVKQFMDKHIL